jgi:hypothetical protein
MRLFFRVSRKEDQVRTVAGVFPSEMEAEKAAGGLRALGIAPDEVIVADGEGHSGKSLMSAQRNMAAAAASGAGWFLAGMIPVVISQRSAAAGGAVGALVGAIFGAIGGLIVHAAPASLFAAINVFAVVPGAALIGAIAGGLVAWVYSLGVSREGVALRAEAVREHGVVVAAHVTESAEQAAIGVMTEHGAARLRADADAWLASGWTAPHPHEHEYPSDSSIRCHEMPE